MNHFRRLLAPLIFFAMSWPALAMETQDIPELLKPWIPWVMDDQPQYECPFFHGDFEQKHCSWAGQLTLELESTQGRFSGDWTLYQPDWIVLPGDNQYWPQQVLVNQKPAIVLEHQGKPAVWMPAGHYRLGGQFIWDKLPENLAIAEDTGLIRLSIDGKSIPYPRIDQGALWLSTQAAAQDNAQQNSLDLQVFRQVIDDNPLQMITRLELNVSGIAREVALQHGLLPDFIPVRLDSPLPARLESDGRLLVQVRAGRWIIDIHARHPQPLERLDLAIADAAWPDAELWAFQAMPDLRLVEIDNLASVDASQTNMPPEWRHLPAYQIKQGQGLHFKLIRRGDPEPEPNQLNLERKLWLDFDGTGYSVSDRIIGNMSRDWRLSALPENRLGQVLLNGQNQLITQQNDGQGVEVRQGRLALQADSRMQADIGRLNAVGWQQSFRQAQAELNIPPGWRLLAVSGVDNEPDSWLTRWTLLDVFLVLIVALAVARLWSKPWGILALLGLVLFWHEADAPRWIWLNSLAALALLRVLPENRFTRWARGYRNLCWLGLIVIVVPFMITQIRIGMYPQLEKPWQPIMPAPYLSDAATMAAQEMDMAEPMSAPAMEMQESLAKRAMPMASKPKSLEGGSATNFNRIDPEANLQTGPGLPQWQWQTVQLSWNGAVDSRQQVRLWYLSPPWWLLVHVAQALVAGLMTLQMLGVLNKSWRFSLPNLSVWLLLPLLAMPATDGFADIPDQAMLEQLKTRLLEAPKYLPSCAQIPQMSIAIKTDALQIELQAHAQQHVAVPLPARLMQWFPEQVTVDGREAETLIRQDDGSLWLGLAEGVHTIVMQGRLAAQDKFTLPLPLPAQYVRLSNDGWRVDGLYENGKTGPQLEFNRLNLGANQQTQNLHQAALPAFVRVERTLHLGLDWQISTRVVQLAGTDTPVVLELPLLPGEAVINADIRVKDGKVLVNMPAGQDSMEWQSMLKKVERLELRAADTPQWSELWRADVSPIWHIETSGIAVVHHQGQQGIWLPEWRPWPGETVTLNIGRPKAVPGATLTIDKSLLKFQPGQRSLIADLTLDVRSSKGGQHTLQLPPQAVLQNVSIDGIAQPIRQKGQAVILPIHPGTQQIALNWQMNQAQSTLMKTPVVNLGMNSVNNHIQVLVADGRWVLFTFGPKFGPAALIWGLLVVLLLVSLGLGRVPLTPLQSWQWFLLLIGLSQLHITAALVVVGWLFALGVRARHAPKSYLRFNLTQVGLALLTLTSLLLLCGALYQGLLGDPDMQISGNQSNATNLNWYQDHSGMELPTAMVVSVPMNLYRLLMLCWSLWMAISLVRYWLVWGWNCFASDGLWRKKVIVASPADT